MQWPAQFVQDMSFGFRSLVKTPSIALIAVLSAALGIGAATAIFSVIYGVIIEPFPYRDVDSLMSIKVWEPGQQGWRTYYSTDQFLEFAERTTIFDGVIASTISDVLWTGIGEPQRLRGNYITDGTFRVMGVPALYGRAAEPADFIRDAPPIAVLGYRFWQRQFGGDTTVIGRRMLLNGKSRMVVGIMPKRFMWRGADVYLPILYERGRIVDEVTSVHVLGRLKPGVTQAQAEVDLKPIIADLKAREPNAFPAQWRVGLLSFKETFPSGLRRELGILFGAVGLLLLIACANISNLLLTKALARRKEMAVRAALGAGRWRLVRQLLTESLMVAMAGGVLGLMLAQGSLKVILTLVPPGTFPDESEVVVNFPVMLFAVAVCALTAILFGLAPALQGSRGALANPLKETGRGTGSSRREVLLRDGMVITSVALSLVLLVGAGLMSRTMLALQDVEIGFPPDRILSLRIPLPEKQYSGKERRLAFFNELLDRVKSLPGVRAVGFNTGLHPMGGMGAVVEVVGNVQQDTRRVLIHHVNEGYMGAVGILLREGRILSERDIATRRNLAVVNELFVKRYSSGQSAIGRIVRVPRLASPPFSLANHSFEIIGVTASMPNSGLANEILPEIFIPYTLTGLADRLAVRADTRADALAGVIRSQVLAIDKNQPITDVRTVESFLREYVYATPRFNFILLGIFAAIGLTLAVIGVYGVISNAVSRRTQEFGVRMALGATIGDIIVIVMRRGAMLIAAGIVLGLGGSLFAVRFIENQIWKVPKYDWISFTGMALLLLVIGLLACYLPARRASKVDPVDVLRYE
jgi:putative ABC transport system permease protein